MNQLSQIKSCIFVWNNRLKRFESEMRKKREQVESKQKAYENSISEAERSEQEGALELQKIAEEMNKGNYMMKELSLFLSQEKKVRQNIEEKKHDIKRHQYARDEAQQDYEQSKLEVSKALRKLEKYQLISATLG